MYNTGTGEEREEAVNSVKLIMSQHDVNSPVRMGDILGFLITHYMSIGQLDLVRVTDDASPEHYPKIIVLVVLSTAQSLALLIKVNNGLEVKQSDIWSQWGEINTRYVALF